MVYLTKGNPNFEAIFLALNETTEEHVWVHVSKVGGGTLGHEYEGAWDVKVTGLGSNEGLLHETLYTDTPRTHRQVSDMAVKFI